jgi:RHS repeat-associated protein
MTLNTYNLLIILNIIYLFFAPNIASSTTSQPKPFSGSVNVITGDYSQMATDITIPSPKPLTIQRYFFGINSGTPDDGLAWHFNHPGILSPNVSEIPLSPNEDSKHEYTYDSNDRLTEIKVTNINGEKVFSFAQFDYQSDGNENVCEVSTSDGRQLFYCYQEDPVTRGTPGIVINNMIDPMGNETRYYYRQHPNERKKLIKKIEDPQGGYLETEYYDGKHNNVGGVLVTVDDPVRDFRIGRIKLQKAPLGPDGSSVITQRFFYHRGSTDVIHSNGQKTTYRYNEDHLLTAVETYNEGSIHKSEKFYWSAKVGDKTSKRLVSKTLESSTGQVVHCNTYEYDDRGQLIKEKSYGNITGTCTETIELTNEGLPTSSQIECAEWSYTYEQYGEEKESTRLIKQIEPNGKVTRFLYDGNSLRIHAILVGDQERTHIRQFNLYNEDGLLTETITDDGGHDSIDNLQNVTERHTAKFHLRDLQPALGMPERVEEWCCNFQTGENLPTKNTTFHYSDQNKIIQQDIYDASNNFAYSIYQNFDALGRKTSQSEESGKETFWDFDANGNVTHELVKDNNQTSLSIRKIYDKANRLIKVITLKNHSDEEVVSFRYNSENQKIADTDGLGNETRYQYDQIGRLLSVTQPAVLTNDDSYDHPKESYKYDIFDQCIKKIDPNGYVTNISYNTLGKPIKILHPDNTTEEFEYYLDGSIKKQIDKLGVTTLFHRDYQSRVIKEEKLAPSGRLTSSVSSFYNSFHLLYTLDSRGVKISYEYDSDGRQKSITKINTDGLSRVEYEYDHLGHVLVKKEWFGDNPNDFSKLITERDSANNIIEARIEDANGDTLRRQIGSENDRQQSSKNSSCQQKSHSFGKHGQLTYQEEITDDLGFTIQYSYDALRRVESVIKKNQQGDTLSEVEMRYDLVGNKVKEIHHALNNKGNSDYILTWKYGPKGRVEGIVEGEGSREQRTTLYSYNEYGQLETIIKPDRVTLTHYYNEMGSISRYFSSDGTIDYEYLYDENGNVHQVIDRVHASISQKDYNDSGLVTEETLINGIALRYTYDKMGRRTSYTLPDESSVHYDYNAANLVQITRKDTKQHEIYCHEYTVYDLSGKLLNETFANNCGNITYQYDQQGHRISAESPWWTESTEWETYNHPQNMHLSGLTTIDPLGEVNSHFTFDGNARVVQETGQASNNYTYDTFGNRASCNGEAMTTNSVNGLTHDGEYHYIYDANGNLKEKVSEGESFSFQYDALNRLTSVIIDEDLKIQYNYDPQSRRTEKIIQEYTPSEQWEILEIKKFIYVDNNEIGEVNTHGEITTHRILGLSSGSEIGATVALEIDDTLYATINDYRGNITCLVNANTSEVTEFYRYTAFGEETIFSHDLSIKSNEEALCPWRYSSKRYETETNLVYFGKRYYSPKIGRWITTDPLGYVDGINRYCYVHNNPLENIDHYGLFSFSKLWNSIVSIAENVMNVIMDFGSKALSFIQAKTRYLQQIQPDVTSTLEEYFGKGFLTLTGYYSHPLESGVYGQGEASDKVRITLLNGISNIRSYYRLSLELLNSTHGGVNIHYIFRPTSGWCGDMIMALLIKCGYVSPYAKELVSTWKHMIAEMGGVDGGGTIIHYCHSLGGTDTVVAASLLSPEERKMINIITFGSATMISNNLGFGDAINFVSIRDGVCLLDPIGYIKGLMGVDTNIAFIGSFLGIPLIDHSLAMDTYTETITKLGHVFLQMYAYGGGLI